MNERETKKVVEDTYDFVDGYVTTNATTQHVFGRGSASGEIVYSPSLEIQKIVHRMLNGTDKEIIACGGINSVEKVLERIEFEPQENKKIQILAPLFYRGPGLLRKLRRQ